MTLRVLLANVTLSGRTGTEVVVRDLALALASRGHRAAVYAPGAHGPLAAEIQAAGIPVVAELRELDEPPDVVHGHHAIETLEALRWAPEARGVFVCHDRVAAHSIPPRHPRILQYIAVDRNCLERVVDDWQVPATRTRVIPNAVDLVRFRQRGPLPAKPARALVFSHYASPMSHPDLVRRVCEPLGISVDVAGSRVGRVIVPEERLADYDLVFAKGRSALEAIAVGAAVVLCDANGLGPMVTAADLPRLRPWNLGARVLTAALDADRLAREIARYDPHDAAEATRLVREEAALERALGEYERAYADAMNEPLPAKGADDIRAFVGPLLDRAATLEMELAAFRQGDRMSPLDDGDVSRIRLSIDQAPSSMAAGGATWVRVRVSNGLADRSLGTWPPFPLQFACRWRRLDAPQPVITDGAHTPLAQPVPPGESRTLALRAVAPSVPGRYQLRVVLVQEWWRWLDETPTPVVADAEIAVVRPTLLTGLAGAARTR